MTFSHFGKAIPNDFTHVSPPMTATRQLNATVKLTPLPNPFPVPNTPFSLDFQQPGLALRVNDVIGCINQAHDAILAHIAIHGDTPIPELPDQPLSAKFYTVEFKIARYAAPGVHVLSYRDVIAVLRAFGNKLSREGFYGQLADIIMTQGGAPLGSAIMYRGEDG